MVGSRVLTFGGVAVHERLLGRVGELADAVLAAVLEQVPFYREMPGEEVTGEIVQTTRRIVRTLGEVVRDRRVPEVGELGWLADAVARRAEEGVPLASVLSAYCIGGLEAWRRVSAEAGPDDLDDVRAGIELWAGFLRVMMVAVTEAYVAELRSMQSQEQTARQTLLSALLAGEPAEEAAGRCGIRLPAGYLVLALRVGEHPDEKEGGVGAAIAGRRKMRRIQAELGRLGAEPTLSLVDSRGGVVLVPSTRDLEGCWAELGDVVRRARDAAGAELTVAAAYAAPDGVAAAAAQSREVLEVVRVTERPAGLYRLSDVLLDYQLSRSTPATPALAALLEPLVCNEDLLATLRLHLDNELNRQRTARMLGVHPNTVDYRLRRIAALTGLDPAVPSHLPVLVAALAARRVTGDAVGNGIRGRGPDGR